MDSGQKSRILYFMCAVFFDIKDDFHIAWKEMVAIRTHTHNPNGHEYLHDTFYVYFYGFTVAIA